MKIKTTFILLVLAVGLLSFVWFKERHATGYNERKASEMRLFDFNPSEVVQLVVQGPKGIVVAKKENDQWSITEPITTAADTAEVQSMIQLLSQISYDRVIAPVEIPGESLDKNYLLKEPEFILTWITPQERYSLRLGADTPMSTGMFAQKEENGDIYIIPRYARETLARELSNLRTRVIFPLETQSVTQIDIRTLSTPQPSQIQINISNQIAQISIPIVARANTQKISELTEFLVDSRAMDFVSEGAADLKTYGLSEPHLEVSLRTKGVDKAMTLTFGEPVRNDPEKYYAKLKDSNSIITVTALLYKELTASLQSYRDPYLINKKPDEISQIVIQSGAKSMTLTRKEKNWMMGGPEARPADNALVAAFLQSLIATPIHDFLSDAPSSLKPFALDPASTSISLTDPSGVLKVDLGKRDKSGVYAKRSDEIFIYKVSPDILEYINLSPDFFLNRQIASLDSSLIHSVKIIQKEKTITLTKNSQGKWTLNGDTQGVLNNERLQTLFAALSDFRAVKGISADQKNTGLDSPVLQLVITMDSGEENTFNFGNTTGKNERYLNIPEKELLYVVDESIFTLLDKELCTVVNPK